MVILECNLLTWVSDLKRRCQHLCSHQQVSIPQVVHLFQFQHMEVAIIE